MARTAADTEVLHIRIPAELKAWLEEESQERMVGVTKLVIDAVKRLRDSIPAATLDA